MRLVPVAELELTEEEKAAIEAWFERSNRRLAAVRDASPREVEQLVEASRRRLAEVVGQRPTRP